MTKQEDSAEYILAHVRELRTVAQLANLNLLVYFLELAISEADAIINSRSMDDMRAQSRHTP